MTRHLFLYGLYVFHVQHRADCACRFDQVLADVVPIEHVRAVNCAMAEHRRSSAPVTKERQGYVPTSPFSRLPVRLDARLQVPCYKPATRNGRLALDPYPLIEQLCRLPPGRGIEENVQPFYDDDAVPRLDEEGTRLGILLGVVERSEGNAL